MRKIKSLIVVSLLLAFIMMPLSVNAASHTSVFRDDLGDVTGNAVNSVYNTLDAALTAIGTTETTLFINQSLNLTASSVTVPSNVSLNFMKAGSIHVGSNQRLTINGPVIASPTQRIFTTDPTLVQDGDSAWNEQTVAGVTASTDTADKKQGTASAKLVMTGSATAGILASKSIPALNMTKAKVLTMWVKSSIGISNTDMSLVLDDSANGASPLKVSGLDGLAANTWKKVTVNLEDVSTLSSIISVGIRQNVAKGAYTLWIDGIEAVNGVTFGEGSASEFYPQWWGAKGDGVTDDTTPVQNALNAASLAGQGTVKISKGTYLVENLVLYGNTELTGKGWSSILKQKSGAQHVVSVNPGGGGNSSINDNQKNIRINNIQLSGTVTTDGFDEHKHILNLNAVSDVVIDNVKFVGFRGDGLYIGSSNYAATERHNERITVRKSYFDGVNNNNRNGISIIDCDGCLIDDSYFTNTTRSDMPGAIDIEPDAASFHVIRNITIRNNKFYNIGGFTGVIQLYLPTVQASLTKASQHILIEGNYIDTAIHTQAGIALQQYQTVTNSTAPNNIVVRDNRIDNAYSGFKIYGIKGAVLDSNTFTNIATASYLGYSDANMNNQDIHFTNNSFRYSGTTDGYNILVYSVDRLSINGDTYDDVGKSDLSLGYGLYFVSGASSYVRITNTMMLSPLGRTTWGIKKGTHTFASSTNIWNNNQSFNVPGNDFQYSGGESFAFDWGFASTTEGWTSENQITQSVSGGINTLTSSGSDPFLYSGDNLNISASTYKFVKVRMKNNTSSVSSQLFFTTTADTSWSEAKSISKTITASDSGYTEYVFDFSAIGGWSGTIKQLRFDPVVAPGTVEVDYIRVSNTG